MNVLITNKLGKIERMEFSDKISSFSAIEVAICLKHGWGNFEQRFGSFDILVLKNDGLMYYDKYLDLYFVVAKSNCVDDKFYIECVNFNIYKQRRSKDDIMGIRSEKNQDEG